jgi:hypothetical protein
MHRRCGSATATPPPASTTTRTTQPYNGQKFIGQGQPAGPDHSGRRAGRQLRRPDFKLPSLYKANLAFDHELPWYGMVASAELLVTKVKDGLYYQQPEPGQGPSGRCRWSREHSDGHAADGTGGTATMHRAMVMPQGLTTST